MSSAQNVTMTQQQLAPPLPYPCEPLLPWISDLNLLLATPIVVHWLMSLAYSIIEYGNYFRGFRTHTSAEELTRNTVSRTKCLKGVLLNQAIQTGLGIVLSMIGDGDMCGGEELYIQLWASRLHITVDIVLKMIKITGLDLSSMAKSRDTHARLLSVGMVNGVPLLARDLAVAQFLYQYVRPMLQVVVAAWVADTWQYFGHRWLHTNKWAFKHIHSIHHHLYVPYSFGAAYTHPLEGLFLDSMSYAVAMAVSGLSTQHAVPAFAYSSFKAVTDHGGYVVSWNPILWFSDNDAGFHDLHHQRWGLKHNFGVHFAFWDRLMGTEWTDKGKARELYSRGRVAADVVLHDKMSRMDHLASDQMIDAVKLL